MANNPTDIDYNQNLAPLEKLLSSVKRAGDFFVSGLVEVPMPRIEVTGVGVLSFPVPPSQILQLTAQATQAPYGRGEETILDESVRKVWQLPPSIVRVSGKSWEMTLDGILQRTTNGLGCDGMTVVADLYKMLVYETGGFFLAHRDTEKADGMFGTLVVILPSAHRGGELVIRHAGREAALDLSGAEVSELGFIAFYADCEHEVRPIIEGARVCLIYNLLHKPSAKTEGETPGAPDYTEQIAAAAALLEENLSGPGAPPKIAWLFEHQYSPDGLSFSALKSGDRGKAEVLAAAAKRVNCAVHLGIVHIEESGSAEPRYQSYRSRRWERSRDYAGEATSSGSDAAFDVVEVVDTRHYISQWRDLNDLPVNFGEIPVAPGELLPDGALDGEKPDQQRLMEASGNEGATFDRSYHRAALVIWRRDRYAEVLLQSGVASVLPYFKERIEACAALDGPSAARDQAIGLGTLLLDAWEAAPRHFRYGHPRRPEKREDMLNLLITLGEPGLVESFIARIVTMDYDDSDNAGLVAASRLVGAKTTGQLISELVAGHTAGWPGSCVELLGSLTSGSKNVATPEWRNALRTIAAAITGKLDEIRAQKADFGWRAPEMDEKGRKADAAFVTSLLDALHELEAHDLRATAVKKLAARPEVFDPVTILAPALASIRSWDAAATQLWEHTVEFLLDRSGRPPAAPTDWRQDVKIKCGCAECHELQAFTLDPVEQIHRFRVRQDRRCHLETIIAQHNLDMNCVTERKGSPQSLVCTKDRRSYLWRCERYRKDVKALASLEEHAGKLPAGSQGAVERIAAARARAKEWSPA